VPRDGEHRSARELCRLAHGQRLVASIEIGRERRRDGDITDERTFDHLERRGVAHRTTVSREQRQIGIHRRQAHLCDAIAHVVLR